MFKKIWDFFHTDLGEIIAHCLVSGPLMLLVDWYFDDFRELVGGMVIIAGFIVWELSQHKWQFAEMGKQSWKELIYPAIVVLVIYAV